MCPLLPHPVDLCPGHVKQDPADWIDAIRSVLRTLAIDLELAPTACNRLSDWDNANVQKKTLGRATLPAMLMIVLIVLTAFLSI